MWASTHRVYFSYTHPLTCSFYLGAPLKQWVCFPSSEKLWMTNKWLWDGWNTMPFIQKCQSSSWSHGLLNWFVGSVFFFPSLSFVSIGWEEEKELSAELCFSSPFASMLNAPCGSAICRWSREALARVQSSCRSQMWLVPLRLWDQKEWLSIPVTSADPSLLQPLG